VRRSEVGEVKVGRRDTASGHDSINRHWVGKRKFVHHLVFSWEIPAPYLDNEEVTDKQNRKN
jgi:hypothetical protein